MMSLRRQLLLVATALGVLAMLVTAALVIITERLRQQTERGIAAVESIRAAEELEINLLVHQQVRRVGTSELPPQYPTATVESELRRWLSVAKAHVGSDEERRVVERVQRTVEAYLAADGDAAGRRFDEAYAALETLVDLNVADARTADAEAARLDKSANGVGMLALALLVAVIALTLGTLRSGFYGPVLSLQQTISRLARGDATARAPVTGPSEFQIIAQTLNEMADALHRQNEIKLRVLASIAHDLRNPLAALSASTGMVSPDRPLPTEATIRRMYQMVHTQVERLDRLVGDLLDSVRIEAGQLELRLETRDLRRLVDESVELHRMLSPAHTVVSELPPDPVFAMCDPMRVSQVLNNLLSNAIKYSPGGGEVRVRLAADGATAAIAVSDPGMGIPSEDLLHIFEPFRRSAASRETVPGVGLGLSVAKRIVEAHGGTIDVISTLHRGSTFRVRLPATGMAGHATAPGVRLAPAPAPSAR